MPTILLPDRNNLNKKKKNPVEMNLYKANLVDI